MLRSVMVSGTGEHRYYRSGDHHEEVISEFDTLAIICSSLGVQSTDHVVNYVKNRCHHGLLTQLTPSLWYTEFRQKYPFGTD